MDPTDSTQVKVWVYCSDVGLDSGPLTILPAAASDLLAERIGYAMDERYRIPDDVVESLKTDKTVPLVGRTGSVSFVDTSCCFHFGSRVEAGGVPRRLDASMSVKSCCLRDSVSFRRRAVGVEGVGGVLPACEG
jgi:hypothetical protein